jgi:hypothetical protein
MKLGKPQKLEIKPNKEKTEFQFLLSFDGRTQPIEFVLSFGHAMLVMRGLQDLQAMHKIPIPRQARPSGKPQLSIVKPDE